MRNQPVAAAAALALALTAMVGACTPPVATANVGQCMNIDDLRNSEITEITTVDCSTEHDAQAVGKFDLEGEGEFPGQDGIRIDAENGCVSAFSQYVGISYEETILGMTYIMPSTDSWSSGDREILCIAYLKDDTTATESWENAAL